MTELLLEIFGGWVRAGLAALSVYLIEHHLVTASQGDRLSTELFTHIMLAAPMVITLAWTAVNKYRSRVKFLAGLSMAPTSTENDVLAKIKSGEPTPTVTTPPDTIPGVPKP